MIKRRLLATIALAASGALVVGACSSGADAGEGETTELRVLVNVTPNLTEEWWNDLVDPYRDANPAVDVIIQNSGAEGVEAAVPRLLAAGDVPDIVQSIPPSSELAPELVDLSEYDWATNGPLAEQYTIDGSTYMAGIGIQLQSLWFYNKDAFEEAGIDELPTSLDEMEQALEDLHQAGWVPIQTAGDWSSSHALQALALPNVIAESPDWFAQMSAGEVTFSDTYGFAVHRYADWIANDYVNDDALGVQYPDAEQNFIAGNTALYPMGSWFAGAEASAADAPEIGVFRSPSEDGVTNPAMGANVASPYLIMRASENQDAAADLLEYLTTDQDAVTSQLEVEGNYRDGYEYDMTALGRELLEIVADTPASDYTPTGEGYGERVLPGGYSSEINAQTQALLGGTSAEDVISAMDAWFVTNAE